MEASLVVAKIVTPFLKKFQTDCPMLPFFSTDMFDLLKKLLNKILKTDVLSDLSSAKDIHKLDMEDSEIFRTGHSIDVGTAAKDLLRKIKPKTSDVQVLAFRNNFGAFIRALVKKLLDKSPIKHKLVRCCTFLDPSIMIKEKSKSQLVQILDVLREAKKLTASECDAIQDEFDAFRVKMDRELFGAFKPTSSERLDRFLHQHLKEPCPQLWKVVEVILVLSHGQSSVERGFSFNKEISVENLSEVSLIAQRRLTDYIKRCGGTTEVPLTKELLSAAASGRQNYQQHLEREKEKKRLEQSKRKIEIQTEELLALKQKKQKLLAESKDLVTEADKLAAQAEAKSNFLLLSRSNALREKGKLKFEEVTSLDASIQEKLQQF